MNAAHSSETTVSQGAVTHSERFLFEVYHQCFSYTLFSSSNCSPSLSKTFISCKSLQFCNLPLPFQGTGSKRKHLSPVSLFKRYCCLQCLLSLLTGHRLGPVTPTREQICFCSPHLHTLNPESPVRCDRTFAASQDVAEITQEVFRVWFGGLHPKAGLTLNGRGVTERFSTRGLWAKPTTGSPIWASL